MYYFFVLYARFCFKIEALLGALTVSNCPVNVCLQLYIYLQTVCVCV
jgi:hypothetical protein